MAAQRRRFTAKTPSKGVSKDTQIAGRNSSRTHGAKPVLYAGRFLSLLQGTSNICVHLPVRKSGYILVLRYTKPIVLPDFCNRAWSSPTSFCTIVSASSHIATSICGSILSLKKRAYGRIKDSRYTKHTSYLSYPSKVHVDPGINFWVIQLATLLRKQMRICADGNPKLKADRKLLTDRTGYFAPVSLEYPQWDFMKLDDLSSPKIMLSVG